jgi:CDP-glucose 4,6-dehydratase
VPATAEFISNYQSASLSRRTHMIAAPEPSFWKGKRVLLTGHTGFKGSWLSLWLERLGANLVGYALSPPTEPNHFEAANVAAGMTSIIGDVRDFSHLTRIVNEHRPEIVLHLAAQSVVRTSYDAPRETYEVNVMGTVNVLEAVRLAAGVRSVVNVTTDKCYENREWVWGYREDEPMGGHDPYSNSKGCSELVTSAFRSSFFATERYGQHGVAIGSARAGNVVGGGDWTKDQLVPDVIRAFSKGEQVRLRSPGAIRPWQFVLEPLSGYLLLAERLFSQGPKFAEGWNFGPPDEDAKTVQWIVEKLAGDWGERAGWQVDRASHPHEAHFLKLDSSKARARLDWAPRLRLGEALEWIVEWYRDYAAAGDIRARTVAQIERYEARLRAT